MDLNVNWYLDPIRNKYADFTGRAGRQEFWMFFLFNLVIGFVLYLIDMMITGGIIAALYGLAVLIPGLAIGARRLHDTNKSGWYQLLGLIPFVGLIIMIYLFAQPGDPETNQYGSPPVVATQPGLA
ncbi:MAG: DUF805 domain-containing protein [Dehalococcoidia bacterium]